jgi:hypothetical protein
LKKLLAACIALAGAVALYAQTVETYTFPATQAQVNRVDLARQTWNERTCHQAGLPLDCTESELQAVGGEFATLDIYPSTQAGRTELIADTVLIPWFVSLLDDKRGWDSEKGQVNWCAGDTTFRNAACAALDLTTGCQLYVCP